jgi:hypothetical protein
MALYPLPSANCVGTAAATVALSKLPVLIILLLLLLSRPLAQ